LRAPGLRRQGTRIKAAPDLPAVRKEDVDGATSAAMTVNRIKLTGAWSGKQMSPPPLLGGRDALHLPYASRVSSLLRSGAGDCR